MHFLSIEEMAIYAKVIVCFFGSSDNAQIFCANDFTFLDKQNLNSFQGQKESGI